MDVSLGQFDLGESVNLRAVRHVDHDPAAVPLLQKLQRSLRPVLSLTGQR